MKAAFVIFVFCAISSFTVDAIGEDKELVDAANKCTAEAGVDPKIVTDLFTKKEAKSDDPKVRCFFKCFWGEIKWWDNSTNDILLEGPWYSLDEPMIKIVKDCAASVDDSDPCDKAYNFNKCIVEKKPE